MLGHAQHESTEPVCMPHATVAVQHCIGHRHFEAQVAKLGASDNLVTVEAP